MDNLIWAKYIPADREKSNEFYSALNISQNGRFGDLSDEISSIQRTKIIAD
jgi:hypothetical protein